MSTKLRLPLDLSIGLIWTTGVSVTNNHRLQLVARYQLRSQGKGSSCEIISCKLPLSSTLQHLKNSGKTLPRGADGLNWLGTGPSTGRILSVRRSLMSHQIHFPQYPTARAAGVNGVKLMARSKQTANCSDSTNQIVKLYIIRLMK